MKPIPILLACLALLSTPALAAQKCSVPVSKLSIEGMRLGESVADFRRRFAGTRLDPSGSGSEGLIDLDVRRSGMSADVDFMMHVAYERNRISSFMLVYDDMETPLSTLAARWIKRYGLPQSGWKKSRQARVYRCADYEITLKQDFGAGRGTTGAGIMLKAIPEANGRGF